MYFKRDQFFKHLAILTILLGFLPLISLVNIKLLNKSDVSSVLPPLLFFIGLGYCGYIGRLLNAFLEEKHFLISIRILMIGLYYVVFIGLAIVLIALYTTKNIVGFLGLSLLIAIGCSLTFGAYDKEYFEIFTPIHYRFILISSCLTALFIPTASILLTLLVTTYVFGFLKNQTCLDEMLSLTEENTTGSSKSSIRRYTSLTFFYASSLLIVGYILRDYLGELPTFIIKSIFSLFLGCINLLNLLLQTSSSLDAPKEPAPLFSPPDGTTDGSFINFIFTLIFFSVFFIIVIKMLLKHFNQFRLWIAKIKLTINQFIFSIFKVSEAKIIKQKGFYDQLESIDCILQILPKHSSPTAKQWKKEFKLFIKKEQSTEKYVLGYRLLRTALQLNHIELRPSDTPLEILSKMNNLPESSQIESISLRFNAIKYGENIVVDEDFEMLTSLLCQFKKYFT